MPELLVQVYSYCLMVKSVSCYSMHGSRLFSNLVTINEQSLDLYVYRFLSHYELQLLK